MIPPVMDSKNVPRVNLSPGLASSLKSVSETGFESARALPGELYSSQEMLVLERQHIFSQEWICVGRTAEIPKAGDYLTFDIVNHPVLVVRQDDASIEAFSNICLHRGAKLVEGCGTSTRFVCPYHAWTYSTDGRLTGTRFMEKTPGFNTEDYRLAKLRCEVWEGFIYVTLDAHISSVAERLTDLSHVVGSFRVADYRHVFTKDEVWPANWKCFVENYMDAYHLFKVHAKTFGQSGHYEDLTRLYDGGNHYTYHLVDSREGDPGGVAHRDNHWIRREFRRTTVLACVFPSHTMQLQPDFLWYVTVQPHGVDHFRMRWSVSVPDEILADLKDPDAYTDELRDFLIEVNSEDEAIVSRAYAGLRANTSIRGPLSYLERNVYRFDQYLARQLCT